MFGIESRSTSEGSSSAAAYSSPAGSSDDSYIDDTPADLSMFGIFSDNNNDGSLISDADAPSYLPLTGLSQFGIGNDRSGNSDGTALSSLINTDDTSFDFSSLGMDLDDSNNADVSEPSSSSTSDDNGVDLSQFGISDFLSDAPHDTDDTDDSSIDLSPFGIYIDGNTSDNDSNDMSSDITGFTSENDPPSLGVGSVIDDLRRSMESASQYSLDLSQFGIRSDDHGSDSTEGSLLIQRGLANDASSEDLSRFFDSVDDSGDNGVGDIGSTFPVVGQFDIFESIPFMSETKTVPTKPKSVSETLSSQTSESLPLEQTDASVVTVSSGADPTPSLSSMGITLPESAINVNNIIPTSSLTIVKPSPAQPDTPNLDLKSLGVDLPQLGPNMVLNTPNVFTRPHSTPSEQQNTATVPPEVEYNILLDTTGDTPLVPGFDVIKTETFDRTSRTPGHDGNIRELLQILMERKI